jgi:hypothetical protein
MLPRRRNIGGNERLSPENPLDTYDKLDKKGSHTTKPYISTAVNQYRNQTLVNQLEEDYKFDFLEDFVFETVMAARDRTNEFIATVRSLQGRTLARPVIRDDRKAAVIETYSQFMSMAKVISKNITSTYAKLEKLAMCKLYLHIYLSTFMKLYKF